MKKWQIPLRETAIILTKCGGSGGFRQKAKNGFVNYK
jgi:hypothetical protein